LTNVVGLGPVFGPHISFAAGTAAAAYAARKGYMDTGFHYGEAKNISAALGSRPDVLAVGGAFGILGLLVAQVSANAGLPWDPIAMGIVVSALLHRVAFGYPLIGTVRGDGYLDLTPFERGERRRGPSTTGSGNARVAVEPWLAHHYEWENVAMLGLVAGILGAFVAVSTGSSFLAFGISAASLLFLTLGNERFPVTHHITFPAGVAALAVTASGDALISSAGAPTAVVVGTVVGVVCALFAEVFERVFYAHGDTHWDPPAAGIVFGTFLVAVLSAVGVFPSHLWIPLFGGS
jgi:energy-converting hydrogenase Eha subunit A